MPDEIPVWLPYTWEHGEHVALVGTTGSGKTALESYMLRAHRFTLALKTKADNTRLPGKRIRKAEEINKFPRDERFILDPEYERQRYELYRAFEITWKQGAWTTAIDELFAIDSQLKLGWYVDRLLTQGRSNNLSVIMGMQRPKRITRFALSQATHYVVFRMAGDDLRVIVDETTPALKTVIPALDRFEFVWYSKRENTFWKGKLQDLMREAKK